MRSDRKRCLVHKICCIHVDLIFSKKHLYDLCVSTNRSREEGRSGPRILTLNIDTLLHK